MKYCSNCGTQLNSESKFCSGCGTQIAEIATQQIVITPPVAETKVETTTNRILMPDGAIYEGELKDGLANGFGKFTYPEPAGDPDYFSDLEKGLIYEGNFLNGKKHGFGKLYTETYVYEGDWKFNQKSGSGKLTIRWRSGRIVEYIGEFEDDKKNGKGTIREFGETLYPYNFEGEFLQDHFEEGLLIGSFLGTPPTYSIRYKGSFVIKKLDESSILLLDHFPACDGELVFTWLETGESSKHIVKSTQCESYDLMREKAYEEDEDFDDDEDYEDEDDSPIKPKEGAGLR